MKFHEAELKYFQYESIHEQFAEVLFYTEMQKLHFANNCLVLKGLLDLLCKHSLSQIIKTNILFH